MSEELKMTQNDENQNTSNDNSDMRILEFDPEKSSGESAVVSVSREALQKKLGVKQSELVVNSWTAKHPRNWLLSRGNPEVSDENTNSNWTISRNSHSNQETINPDQMMGYGFGPMNNGYSQMNNGYSPMNNGYPQMNNGNQQMGNGYPQMGNSYSQMNNGYSQMSNGYPQMGNGYPQMNNGYPQMGNGYPQMNNGYPQMGNGYPQMGNSYSQMNNGYPQMNNGYPQMGNGYPQMNNNYQQMGDGNSNSGESYMPGETNENVRLYTPDPTNSGLAELRYGQSQGLSALSSAGLAGGMAGSLNSRGVPNRKEIRSSQKAKKKEKKHSSKPSQKYIKEAKKQKKKVSVFLILIIILAIAVAVFAIIKIIGIKKTYDEGTDIYTRIVEEVVDTEHIVEDPQEESVVLSSIDFAALEKINSDIVGWIYFKDPSVINYPITVGRDNEYYLTHAYTGEANSAGSIFIDQEAAADLTDNNVIVYGHNMKNGSMFAELMNYEDESYGKAYPAFYIYSKSGGIYKYNIFAAYKTDYASDTYYLNFDSEQNYRSYLDYCLDQSLYDFGNNISSKIPIITLSTCTNRSDSERFVVQAALSEIIQEGKPEIGVIEW